MQIDVLLWVCFKSAGGQTVSSSASGSSCGGCSASILRGLRPLMKRLLRIGTRGSRLALWQADWVRQAIEGQWSEVTCELVVIQTQGDKILGVPLAQVGGKGLFVKEIKEALLDGRIDAAVHSMKDMPAGMPQGLGIGAVPQRENPQDVLISPRYPTPDAYRPVPASAPAACDGARNSNICGPISKSFPCAAIWTRA